jgi:hypothetical protein
MKIVLTIAVLVVVVFLLARRKGTNPDIQAAHPRYAPGQVWMYGTRPGEDASRVTVLRVDKTDAAGFIIHVRVDDVSVRNPSAPDGVARTISHLPFSADAIDASVLTMEGTSSVPDFQDGYELWREAFDQGKGGVWTVSVAEAVGAMETALNAGK